MYNANTSEIYPQNPVNTKARFTCPSKYSQRQNGIPRIQLKLIFIKRPILKQGIISSNFSSKIISDKYFDKTALNGADDIKANMKIYITVLANNSLDA